MSHTPNDVDSIIKELEASNVLCANPALWKKIVL
jgi:hypothetical protein